MKKLYNAVINDDWKTWEDTFLWEQSDEHDVLLIKLRFEAYKKFPHILLDKEKHHVLVLAVEMMVLMEFATLMNIDFNAVYQNVSEFL